MDRTEGDRNVNLALQFRDYDVNAYLPGTKASHAAGLAQLTEFITARAAAADQINVTVTGSASKTGTQCFNQRLSEKRAQCLAERLLSDLSPGVRAKVRLDKRGDGFTRAECKGKDCELPGYRSVLVSVHGAEKPRRLPPEPPGWDKYCIRVCCFQSQALAEAAVDELLNKLPKDVPSDVARGLIGRLRQMLDRQLRRLLRKLPKLGALSKDLSKLLRFLPIEITRQKAVFRVKERTKPDPRQLTLSYQGFGFRLALPIPGELDDALDELLKKVPGVGDNTVMRKAMREVLKRELKEILPGRVTRLLSKLDSTVPGPWKAFDLNRRAPIEVFRGPADIFVDVISDVMEPGSIFLAFESQPWNKLGSKLELRCVDGQKGCAGSVIQLQVGTGAGFDVLSVNKGTLAETKHTCEPGKEAEAMEEALEVYG